VARRSSSRRKQGASLPSAVIVQIWYSWGLSQDNLLHLKKERSGKNTVPQHVLNLRSYQLCQPPAPKSNKDSMDQRAKVRRTLEAYATLLRCLGLLLASLNSRHETYLKRVYSPDILISEADEDVQIVRRSTNHSKTAGLHRRHIHTCVMGPRKHVGRCVLGERTRSCTWYVLNCLIDHEQTRVSSSIILFMLLRRIPACDHKVLGFTQRFMVTEAATLTVSVGSVQVGPALKKRCRASGARAPAHS
jgi:hypothetical protein